MWPACGPCGPPGRIRVPLRRHAWPTLPDSTSTSSSATPTRTTRTSWVTHFHEFLAQRGARVPRAPGATSSVWRDNEARTASTSCGRRSSSNIESSALFLSICSPVYVTSGQLREGGRALSREQPGKRPRIERQVAYGAARHHPVCQRPRCAPVLSAETTRVYYSFFEERARRDHRTVPAPARPSFRERGGPRGAARGQAAAARA